MDDAEPFSALAFKIASDPFVGKLAFFRVYSGTLKAGSYVLNATKGRKERIGRILQMHANHREEIDQVYAGDIAAAVGLKETFTGDTLSDADHPVILESMTFPEPVIEVAIEPKTKADQDKLGIALQRLAEEDPTFRVKTDEESGQTLIAGMGELHLDVLVDRMVREFHVAANVGKPQVLVSRDHPARREGQRAASCARRAARASTAMPSSTSSPTRRARATSSSTRSSAAPSRANTSSRSTQGIREALRPASTPAIPMVDVKVTLYRRLVPRGRLVGDGLQDRRLAWPSRTPSPRRTRSSSSRSCGSR